MKPSLPLLVALVLACAAGAAAAQPADLTGEQVVKMRCIKCHQAGVKGAPKIGDRDAWLPRMKNGIDTLVRSAIRGHNNMPARGGMAQFTDPEIRAAVLYMINGPAAAHPATAPVTAPAFQSPYHKVIEGVVVDMGIVSAGSGMYHLNVSLHDGATNAEIKDAAVEARVASPLAGQTKKLQPATVNGMTGYGNDFRMSGNEPYTVAFDIRIKGSNQPIRTTFDVRQ